jgi:Major intrinsic protein
MRSELARSLLAEAIGTFALVFAGAGALMVDAKTQALGHVGVAISFGLVIMVVVYALGHISGAHLRNRPAEHRVQTDGAADRDRCRLSDRARVGRGRLDEPGPLARPGARRR